MCRKCNKQMRTTRVSNHLHALTMLQNPPTYPARPPSSSSSKFAFVLPYLNPYFLVHKKKKNRRSFQYMCWGLTDKINTDVQTKFLVSTNDNQYYLCHKAVTVIYTSFN